MPLGISRTFEVFDGASWLWLGTEQGTDEFCDIIVEDFCALGILQESMRDVRLVFIRVDDGRRLHVLITRLDWAQTVGPLLVGFEYCTQRVRRVG